MTSIINCFNYLPNELILIIWSYLGHVEAIKIFGSMKYQRYTRLLEEYCYKSINFRETSLSIFQLYCSYLFNKIRLNVQTFKLGHRTSYSQLRLFTQMYPGWYNRYEFDGMILIKRKFFFIFFCQILYYLQKSFQNYKHLYCTMFRI
jgi:hypothetical protein